MAETFRLRINFSGSLTGWYSESPAFGKLQNVMRHFNKTQPMTTKRYDIFLDDLIIGTTELEKADAPMGVVFGQIQFKNIISGYDFFKKYCLENNIELADDYPEDKLISTRTIENLKVINENGIIIKGIGNQISGMDGDEFEITLEGVVYPFFEEEFPQHVKAYNEQFKQS